MPGDHTNADATVGKRLIARDRKCRFQTIALDYSSEATTRKEEHHTKLTTNP
jgi:hypothetical protein